jgi:hypothetical protein
MGRKPKLCYLVLVSIISSIEFLFFMTNFISSGLLGDSQIPFGEEEQRSLLSHLLEKSFSSSIAS